MKKLFITLIIGFSGFILARPLNAATSLSFSPASGTYGAGSIIKVNVYANTGGENVNTVQANVAYPTDKLQFQSISTAGSALTIFAEKYANGDQVRLAGGAPSPGFSGNKLIASINFKVLAEGAAVLSFTGESAAFRDSDNANVLGGKGTATFTLGKASVTTPSTKPGTTGTPGARTSLNSITISNIVIESVTNSQAIITWKTDVPSDSSIEYGKDSSYGFTETLKEVVTEHRLVLANYLVPGTLYHFQVKSTDASGKEGVSTDATFKTQGFDVTVRIKDMNGKPITGAVITLATDPQLMGETNGLGEAIFSGVAPGKHGATVKYNNQTMIHEIEVIDGQPMTTVDLAFAGSQVRGLPTISIPVLYGIVGVITLIVIILVIYVLHKNRQANKDTDIPVIKNSNV